jgi:hypothetical protein
MRTDMKSVRFDKKKLIPIAVVSLFFCTYLLVGFIIYKDYGVSADETIDFRRGQVNYNRLTGGSLAKFIDQCSQSKTICYYPPAFSMLLYAIAPGGDSQSIYFRRHLFTFAFFALSVFIFFLIGKKIFKDWKIGLLGALFLIISPRIFAHSFYNPKDIPFLSIYVISIYTLLLFLEKKNLFTAILHGVVIGLVCSIRTPGLIIIPITIFFYLFDLILSRDKWKSYLKAAVFLFISGMIAAGLVYWLTPFLYTNADVNFIQMFNVMKQFPWVNYHLYLGKDIENVIPWHYSIVWFSISSPLLYLVLFLIGCLALILRSLKARTRDYFRSLRDFYLVGACWFLPLISVILMKSIIYTDNRQMYFIYPPMLLSSLFGFKVLTGKIRQKTLHWQWVTAIILVAGLAYPVYFMVRNHPYQNTYFNFLAGSKMSVIKERFALDAWGLSVRKGLEYIASTDPAKAIKVKVMGGYNNGVLLLDKKDRKRLSVSNYTPSNYIIETYRYYPVRQVVGGKIVYSIKVGDTDILTVYKMDSN